MCTHLSCSSRTLTQRRVAGGIRKTIVEGDRVMPSQARLDSPRTPFLHATARDYGIEVQELMRRRRRGENEARMVAIYLSRQLGG